MQKPVKQVFFLSIFTLLFSFFAEAATGRYRLMWRDDPATTMVIGWDQRSGSAPKVYYDVVNHGPTPEKFAFSKIPDNVTSAKGMNNHFVRLAGLRSNTTYYFIIADNEGASKVFSFKTAPDKSSERLSIIAGSDSRNHREARVDANKLVAKLRPHCIIFGGDFTENDSDQEWAEWFDDWQNTISKDGRMYPLIVARGNHEFNNASIVDLFDVKNPDVIYALSLGGDLLRVYTLNSMMASGGDQKNWFQRDLAAHPHVGWKFVQYHLATRPHTKSKEEKTDQLVNWSSLFFEYGVHLAIESDAHVVKSTYPLRPSNEAESDEGFVRDDVNGTVYVGEGCWGAPLRVNNDDKSWTRASGSFNCFHWIFVDEDQIEIRFVKTDGAEYVAEVNPNNIFELPRGINIWNPANGSGDVILIPKNREELLAMEDETSEALASRGSEQEIEVGLEILDFAAIRQGNDVIVKWNTKGEPGNLRYELQRSIEGSDYQAVTTLNAKGADLNNYHFVDREFAAKNPGKYVKYRLKQIRPDGQYAIFNPGENQKERNAAVKKAMTGELPKVMSNPATKQVQIKFSLPKAGEVNIRLLNLRQGEVRRWSLPNVKSGGNLESLDVGGIPRGRYLMIVKSGGEVIERYRVMIN